MTFPLNSCELTASIFCLFFLAFSPLVSNVPACFVLFFLFFFRPPLFFLFFFSQRSSSAPSALDMVRPWFVNLVSCL